MYLCIANTAQDLGGYRLRGNDEDERGNDRKDDGNT